MYDVNNKENGKEPIRTFSNTVKQISNELLKTNGAPDGDER